MFKTTKTSIIQCGMLALIIAGMMISGTLASAQGAEKKTAIEKIYDEETRTVHLDPDDPTIDMMFEKRDFSKDNRPPGPVNLSRYRLGPTYNGVPTFFSLPMAVTPEDLTAGKVDVAIVGNPVTGGFGRPGANMAANFVRLGEVIVSHGEYETTIPEIMVDPFKELTVVDYGNIGVDPMNAERSIVHLADMVEEIAKTRAVPILVGGDHATLYPHIVGMGRVHGKGNFTVIHIDAHADNGGSAFGHYVHIGSMNRLAIDEGWVEKGNIIQAGMRSPHTYNRDYVLWWAENGHMFMQAEFRNRGFREVTKEIAGIIKDGPGKVYISIDIDALEPSAAPAVTGPEHGGFTTRELIELIRTVCVSADVIGVDFIEYIPMLDDVSGTTRLVVSRLIRETLGGIALRKKGIREPMYYAPETDSATAKKMLAEEK